MFRFQLLIGKFATALLLFIATGLGPASAELICMSCSEPDQTYICDVDTPDGTPGSGALQLYCAISIARDHNHGSCTFRRVEAAQCQGTRLTYTYQGPRNPLPDESRDLAVQEPGNDEQFRTEVDSVEPGEPSEQQGKKNKEPKTLVDFTEQAVENSADQLKKTGKAVGDATAKTGEFVAESTKKAGENISGAAKKVGKSVQESTKSTWKCLTSWFSDC